jgi:alpha-galactosidase
VRFGLWVEPEMVNPDSTLYTEHPDWIVSQPKRRPRQWRNQHVLDVLQPDVADFVCGVVDRVLAENPGISYLKWDANRPLTDPGSPTLGADRQGNYWLDHARATWRLMETVAERHPEQTLMLCASGGGRVDLGSMRWFHEVWLSDNTDPVDRLPMQWAASHFLPANVVAAHVTREGDRPVAFGCAVAMTARFGFDLDLAAITEDERTVCRRAVRVYRDIRPLVQQGDLWRLIPPGERAALAYVSGDGDWAVVFGFQLITTTNDVAALRPGGLDPDRIYEVVVVDLEEGSSATGTGEQRRLGASLMEEGLEWTLRDSCTARIWVLRSV